MARKRKPLTRMQKDRKNFLARARTAKKRIGKKYGPTSVPAPIAFRPYKTVIAPPQTDTFSSYEYVTAKWTERQFEIFQSFAGTTKNADIAENFYDGYIAKDGERASDRMSIMDSDMRIQARRDLMRRLENDYDYSEFDFSDDFDWDSWDDEMGYVGE